MYRAIRKFDRPWACGRCCRCRISA